MGTFGRTTVLGDEWSSTVSSTVQDNSLSSTAHQRAVVHTPPISGAAATLQDEAGTNAIVQGVGAGGVSEAKDRPPVARLGEGAVQVGDAATDYKCPNCSKDFSQIEKQSRNGSMANHIKYFCPAARGVADGAGEGPARSSITAGKPRLKGKEHVASPATDGAVSKRSAEVLGYALGPEKDGPKKKKQCRQEWIPGCKCVAYDTRDKKHHPGSKILEVDEEGKRAFVHFHNWSEKFDAWVNFSDLAPDKPRRCWDCKDGTYKKCNYSGTDCREYLAQAQPWMCPNHIHEPTQLVDVTGAQERHRHSGPDWRGDPRVKEHRGSPAAARVLNRTDRDTEAVNGGIDEDEDDGGAVAQSQIHGGQGQGVTLCKICRQRHHHRTKCAAKPNDGPMWAAPHSGNRDARGNIPAEVSDQDEEDESGGRKEKQRTAPHGERPEDEEDESSDEQRGRRGGEICKPVSKSFRSLGIKKKDGPAASQDSWNAFKEVCVKNNISTRDEWRKWAGKQSNQKEMEDHGWCLEIKKYFGKSKPIQFWPPGLSFGDLARPLRPQKVRDQVFDSEHSSGRSSDEGDEHAGAEKGGSAAGGKGRAGDEVAAKTLICRSKGSGEEIQLREIGNVLEKERAVALGGAVTSRDAVPVPLLAAVEMGGSAEKGGSEAENITRDRKNENAGAGKGESTAGGRGRAGEEEAAAKTGKGDTLSVKRDHDVVHIEMTHIVSKIYSETPRCHIVPSEQDTNNNDQVFMCVGETLRIKASDLLRCDESAARFKNLQQSIDAVTDAAQLRQMELVSENNGNILRVKFVAMPKQDEESIVEVTLVTDFGEIKRRILFMWSGYAEEQRVLAPGSRFTIEVSSVFHGIEVPQRRKGTFGIFRDHASDDSFTSDWIKLDSLSGHLEVSLPEMIGADKCTQEFCIMRQNIFGVKDEFKLVIHFVTLSFDNIPVELIKDQDISPALAIRLTSMPVDIIKLRASTASIGALEDHGFKIVRDNQIAGTPNKSMDSKEHAVKIKCHDLLVTVNLRLPRIEEWKPPRIENSAMKITKFDLDDMITNMNKSQAQDYIFQEQVSDKKIVTLREDGWHELNLIIGVQFEAMLKFEGDKLSALQEAESRWIGGKEEQLEISVKEGRLLISGTPQARWKTKTGDLKIRPEDFQIDKSNRRFRRTFVVIIPSNKAGQGEEVKVMITCRPLKVFWGIAQTYDDKTRPKNLEKLICCGKDVEVMLKKHRDLGFDILLSCRDTTLPSIVRARNKLIPLIEKVKTVDVVSYWTGHGYEKNGGTTTYLLLKRESLEGEYKYDWGEDSGNVCIQEILAELQRVADHSTFLFLIFDACRINLEDRSENDNPPLMRQPRKIDFKLKLEWLQKQEVIWWSTSSARTAEGGLKGEMSAFTACLDEILHTYAVENKWELNRTPIPEIETYAKGITFIEDAVHRKFRNEVLWGQLLKKDNPEDVQEPQCTVGPGVREAFTFALPPSLTAEALLKMIETHLLHHP